MNEIEKRQIELRKRLISYTDRPAIVHSDLFRATRFINSSTEREELLKRHMGFLDSLGVKLYIPAFNYQFTKTHYIDLRSAPVELGPLNEYMLRQWANWRTYDPIFSFAIKDTLDDEITNLTSLVAFGEDSVFASTVRNQGAIFMYGASISAMTFIHYVENVAGGPVYRYDKQFRGTVISWEGIEREVTYQYHVRPLKMGLDYDWRKIESVLKKQEIIIPLIGQNCNTGFVANAAEIVECLVRFLRDDPLYLLKQESRAWVEPLYEKLGRRFVIADFE